MSGEDEPSETNMTPVTKLVTRNATFVENAQKLSIIHRSSGPRTSLREIDLFEHVTGSSVHNEYLQRFTIRERTHT
jgi:hypothetical protein